MNISELIKQLQQFPPGTKVVVRGYEEGYKGAYQIVAPALSPLAQLGGQGGIMGATTHRVLRPAQGRAAEETRRRQETTIWYAPGYNDILKLDLLKIKRKSKSKWYEGEYEKSIEVDAITAIDLLGENTNAQE